MQPIEVIERLEAASSRALQEQVLLEAFAAGSREFFLGLRWSADPFRLFDLQRVARIATDDDAADDGYSFAEFEALAERLYKRLDAPETARMAIHRAAERCHAPSWNRFYRRILLKTLHQDWDLRAVQRLYRRLADHPDVAAFRIPERYWEKAKSVPPNITFVPGTYLVDGCLSGDRLLAVMDTDSTVSLHTNRVQVDLPAVRDALLPLLSRLPGALVFDGIHHDGRYTIFDVMPFSSYQMGYTARSQAERHAALVAMQEAGYFAAPLSVLPKVAFDGTAGHLAMLRRQMAQDGFVSLIVKDATAGYGVARSGWRRMQTGTEDGPD